MATRLVSAPVNQSSLWSHAKNEPLIKRESFRSSTAILILRVLVTKNVRCRVKLKAPIKDVDKKFMPALTLSFLITRLSIDCRAFPSWRRSGQRHRKKRVKH